jgi:hypothetical protein
MSPEDEPKQTKSSIICAILAESAGGPPMLVEYIAESAGAAEKTVINVAHMNPGVCEVIEHGMFIQVYPDSPLITTQTGNSPLIRLPDETVPRSGVTAPDHRGMMVRYTPLNEG